MDCNTSGTPSPMAPLLPRFSRTGRDTTTSRLFATLMSPRPTHQVRHFCQRGTTGFRYRSFLHIETDPTFWSGLATSHRRKILRQAHGRLLLNLCQRLVHMAIKASLTRRKCVLGTVKDGEL